MRSFSLLFKVLTTILLVSSICSAQTQKIDSLKNLMKTADDTTMVNLIRWQGNYTRQTNPQKAIQLYKQSIEKSKEIDYKRGEIKGMYAIGVSNGMAGNYAESLSYFKQSLSLAEEHNEFEDISMNYGSLGIVYKRIGDYSTSQEYYLKDLKLADSLQLDTDKSDTYINLGILYDLMDQQDKAIESYHKALEVAPEAERAHYENSVLSNLAVIDFDNKDYKTALDKFLAAIAYYEEQGEKTRLALQYANAGACYLNLKKWQLAEDYFLKSLQLAKELSLQQEIAEAYYRLAELRLHQKRYDDAINYSNQNLESLTNMAGPYKQKSDAHELAYTIFQESGQLPRAIYHLNQTMVYKDSLLNETKVREIQNLQIQHEVYLKDKEIKENELELALLNTRVALNNKRMLYLSIIAFLLLLSAGLLYFRFRTKKRANILLQDKNQLISEQKEVIQEMNLKLEKQMLRAQMNPHFIFNSLNSIQHLINSDDRINALKYLSKFSKLLRQVLESSVNINLVLKEEIELLKIYLELESLRFDNAFSYNITIDENLDINEHEMPMLLVQPYAENAILHGLMPKEGKKELSITFNDKMKYVECIIEDNGVGINAKTTNKRPNMPSRGMSITAERIEKLKRLSAEELINIKSLNDGTVTGTRVTILIPKN
ncbi:tetratricopeptide repeat protein [uncultured Allomuricauda sp.]|uniref:tetratricopeptide repeat protein n=1 Tax=Flagellimonas sp. W118 TaxID=3410791 RepID=UPI00261F0948|nr:tetratricopeptide repeat protein [uncultured Allomuricauda sp.]